MINPAIPAKIFMPLENAASLGMFAKDTLGCLAARLPVSRSKDEAKEISFCEITESLSFYFAIPALIKASSGLFSKIFNTSKDKLSLSADEIKSFSKNEIKNIKSAKFSRIVSVFSLTLPLIYSIAPIRNKISEEKTGKKNFTSIINLSDEKREEKDKKDNFYKKLLAIMLGSLGASFGIVGLVKNDKIYQKIEGLIDKVIKNFDFTKNNDLKLSHYAALIYPASILGYFSASRDKYEKAENTRRFSVSVPLLLFGEKMIQNPIYKFFDKKYNTGIFNGGKIKTYNEIMKISDNSNMLKAKNFSYGLTFLINTFLIAAGVSLLNRYETKRKFEKDRGEEKNNERKIY